MRVGITVTGGRLFAQRLPALLLDHPGLKVELVVADRIGDMIEDRLDLALRLGEITDASLVIRPTGRVASITVAAPDYTERHGKPSTPADLAGHTCIVHDIGRIQNVWTFVTPEGAQGFRVFGGFLTNDGRAVHGAARAGYGIAFLPPLEVFDDLRSGELARVERFPKPGDSALFGLSVAATSGAAHATCAGFYSGAGSGSACHDGCGIRRSSRHLSRVVPTSPSRHSH